MAVVLHKGPTPLASLWKLVLLCPDTADQKQSDLAAYIWLLTLTNRMLLWNSKSDFFFFKLAKALHSHLENQLWSHEQDRQGEMQRVPGSMAQTSPS